jgi:hypothetical protein
MGMMDEAAYDVEFVGGARDGLTAIAPDLRESWGFLLQSASQMRPGSPSEISSHVPNILTYRLAKDEHGWPSMNDSGNYVYRLGQ